MAFPMSGFKFPMSNFGFQKFTFQIGSNNSKCEIANLKTLVQFEILNPKSEIPRGVPLPSQIARAHGSGFRGSPISALATSGSNKPLNP
jgi:hypothetical protein